MLPGRGVGGGGRVKSVHVETDVHVHVVRGHAARPATMKDGPEHGSLFGGKIVKAGAVRTF